MIDRFIEFVARWMDHKPTVAAWRLFLVVFIILIAIGYKTLPTVIDKTVSNSPDVKEMMESVAKHETMIAEQRITENQLLSGEKIIFGAIDEFRKTHDEEVKSIATLTATLTDIKEDVHDLKTRPQK